MVLVLRVLHLVGNGKQPGCHTDWVKPEQKTSKPAPTVPFQQKMWPRLKAFPSASRSGLKVCVLQPPPTKPRLLQLLLIVPLLWVYGDQIHSGYHTLWGPWISWSCSYRPSSFLMWVLGSCWEALLVRGLAGLSKLRTSCSLHNLISRLSLGLDIWFISRMTQCNCNSLQMLFLYWPYGN